MLKRASERFVASLDYSLAMNLNKSMKKKSSTRPSQKKRKKKFHKQKSGLRTRKKLRLKMEKPEQNQHNLGSLNPTRGLLPTDSQRICLSSSWDAKVGLTVFTKSRLRSNSAPVNTKQLQDASMSFVRLRSAASINIYISRLSLQNEINVRLIIINFVNSQYG